MALAIIIHGTCNKNPKRDWQGEGWIKVPGIYWYYKNLYLCYIDIYLQGRIQNLE